MFGLGGMELLIILVVGILLIGVPLVVVGIIMAVNANRPKQQ